MALSRFTESKLKNALRNPTKDGHWDSEHVFFRPETLFIAVLCLIAALRVFFFSAAFPFYNNVDEPAHVDLVLKYSKLRLPERGNSLHDPEFLKLQVIFGSPEYFLKPEHFPEGAFPPPPWTWPEYLRDGALEALKRSNPSNHEEYSEPLYYMVAGAWLALGKTFGLVNAGMLYWVRFLNVPIYVLLVLLAWFIGKGSFPENASQRLGLPLIVSFLPQDVFYSINSDVFTPLFSGVAFYSLLRIPDPRTHWIHFPLAGGGIAGAVLVKVTSAPLCGTLAMALLLCLKHKRPFGLSNLSLGRWGLLVGALALPLAAWFGRNFFVLGHLTSAAPKMTWFQWTYKPLSEMFHHPIFGLEGIWYFLHNLLACFWRGEFVWGLERLAHPTTDYFYSVSSLVFLGISVLHLGRPNKDPMEYRTFLMSALTVGLAILLMMSLSICFDYGVSYYPSRALPYHVSGRYILWALYPFMILYISGASLLMGRFAPSVSPLVFLAIMGMAITGVETWIKWPAFFSPYNFFHAPLGAF